MITKSLDLLEGFATKHLALQTAKTHRMGRERFIANHLASTLLFSILYLPILYLIAYDTAFYVVSFYVFFHIFVLFPLFRRGHWRGLTDAFCAMALGGFSIIACTSGGIQSPIVAWFLSIKVGAYWFNGERSGIFWSVLCILVMTGIFFTGKYIYPYAYVMPEDSTIIFSSIIHIGVLLYYFVVLHIYEYWGAKSLSLVEHSAKERDQMFRIVVHDIKNPLAVIIGRCRLLANKSSQWSKEKILSQVENVDKNAKRIQLIIEDTLDASTNKIEHMRQWKLLDLSLVLKEAVNSIQEQAQEKQIEIVVECPAAVTYKSQWLIVYQIFVNVISNAIKYSHSHSKIHVCLEMDEDHKPRFYVRDHGLGMSGEQIQSFLDGLNVGNKPTAGESSSGEGSRILRHFISEIHADLAISSPGHNQGCEFTITFPKVA
ncbi:MAG: HAMP domain-containing histidine kinase [Pseudobacteriovorax sp.]|nr:HAMP domain-containing histidine kinase [Pseudobacteriovorax sp.]